jgi:hypothetical protein
MILEAGCADFLLMRLCRPHRRRLKSASETENVLKHVDAAGRASVLQHTFRLSLGFQSQAVTAVNEKFGRF